MNHENTSSEHFILVIVLVLFIVINKSSWLIAFSLSDKFPLNKCV